MAKYNENNRKDRIPFNVLSGVNSLEDIYELFNREGSWSTSYTPDIVKQLFDTRLSQLSEEEKRAYNTPAAQVQRLMQAGMSRDAALSAVSSDAAAGDATQIGQAMTPAEREQIDSANLLNGINAAVQAVGAIVSLASFGAALPAQLAMNTSAQTAALAVKLAQEQAEEAIKVGNDVASAAKLIEDGSNKMGHKFDPSELFSSPEQMRNAIRGLAKEGYAPATDFMNTESFKSLDSRLAPDIISRQQQDRLDAKTKFNDFVQNFNLREGLRQLQQVELENAWQAYRLGQQEYERNMWENLSASRNATIGLDLQFDALRADIANTQMNTKLAKANIGLVNAQRRRTLSDMFLDTLRGKLLKAQTYASWQSGHASKELSGLYAQQSNLVYQQAGALSLDNLIRNESLFNIEKNGKNGFQYLTQCDFDNYFYNATRLSTMVGTQYLDDYVDYLKNDMTFLKSHAIFNNLYTTDALDQWRRMDADPNAIDGFVKFLRGTHLMYNGLPAPSSTNSFTSDGVNAAGNAAGAGALIFKAVKAVPK